jgi:hypothetical protein
MTRYLKSGRALISAALFGCLLNSAAYASDVLHGIGATGDSASGAATPNSPPVILQSMRGLNFGPGLSYDFAQFGANSSNVLLPGSQVDQLVTQVTAGNVTLGFISASINDLLPNGAAIANGSLSGPALANFENTLVHNVETAANSVLAAGGRVVLSGYANAVDDPGSAAIAADPTMKARAEGAIDAINSQLSTFADSKGIPLINLFALEKSIFDSGSFVVGGVSISLTQVGPDPHDFFVDSLNAGTVIRAEVANLWLEAMNKGFGTNVPLLTDQEILTFAGIGNEYNGVNSFSTAANLSQFATPEPLSMTLLAMGLFAFGCRALAHRRRPAES